MRPAPRLALSLPLSALALAARLDGAGMPGWVLAAAAGGAALTPSRRPCTVLAGAAAAAGAAWLAAAKAGGAALLAGLVPPGALLLLAWHFGRTLRAGREPLIARYTRHDFGHLPTECAGYARRLTLLWTVVFLGAALLHAAALWRGAPAPAAVMGWSGGAMATLFLGEHVVRSLRFPQFGLAHPARTLRAIWRADGMRHAG